MRKPRLLLKTVLSNLAEDEVRDIAWAAHNLSAETLDLSSLKNIMSLLRIDPLHQILVNIAYLFFTVQQQHSVKKNLIIMAFKSQVFPETEGETVLINIGFHGEISKRFETI